MNSCINIYASEIQVKTSREFLIYDGRHPARRFHLPLLPPHREKVFSQSRSKAENLVG
jgi:hypothetical protein